MSGRAKDFSEAREAQAAADAQAQAMAVAELEKQEKQAAEGRAAKEITRSLFGTRRRR